MWINGLEVSNSAGKWRNSVPSFLMFGGWSTQQNRPRWPACAIKSRSNWMNPDGFFDNGTGPACGHTAEQRPHEFRFLSEFLSQFFPVDRLPSQLLHSEKYLLYEIWKKNEPKTTLLWNEALKNCCGNYWKKRKTSAGVFRVVLLMLWVFIFHQGVKPCLMKNDVNEPEKLELTGIIFTHQLSLHKIRLWDWWNVLCYKTKVSSRPCHSGFVSLG